jgi:cyclic pyranopterin monophosphate synthase
MADDNRFSHLDERGRARMVDVSAKDVTRREARASCLVRLGAATLDRLEQLPKGDALAVARVAGIQAAKRTDEWIPLAHPLALERVAVDFEREAEGLRVRTSVVVTARTGAEMEALVACAAAALAIYDLVKAVERGAVVDQLRLDSKQGGRTGAWTREP